MCKLTVKFLRNSVILLAVLTAGNGMAETLGDPTQPPNTASQVKRASNADTLPRWWLTATFIAADRRVATINGKRVAVGDQISGATVMVIEPSWVILQPAKTSKALTLQLLPTEFKRMAEREPDEN